MHSSILSPVLLTFHLLSTADNLNGARVGGRVIKVDHVANYKQREEEDEEEEEKKREERGVCYAFQRGECARGASCRFSHDEQVTACTSVQAQLIGLMNSMLPYTRTFRIGFAGLDAPLS